MEYFLALCRITALIATNLKGGFHMNKGFSVALLAVGIMLSIWGIKASDSFGSDVSRFFTGSPTNKAVWLLIGGIVMGIVGLFGLFRGSKGN
jgi:hypothetical protein